MLLICSCMVVLFCVGCSGDFVTVLDMTCVWMLIMGICGYIQPSLCVCVYGLTYCDGGADLYVCS